MSQLLSEKNLAEIKALTEEHVYHTFLLVEEVKRLRAENKQLRKDLQWGKDDRMAEEERDENSRSPSPSDKDYLEV